MCHLTATCVSDPAQPCAPIGPTPDRQPRPALSHGVIPTPLPTRLCTYHVPSLTSLHVMKMLHIAACAMACRLSSGSSAARCGRAVTSPVEPTWEQRGRNGMSWGSGAAAVAHTSRCKHRQQDALVAVSSCRTMSGWQCARWGLQRRKSGCCQGPGTSARRFKRKEPRAQAVRRARQCTVTGDGG